MEGLREHLLATSIRMHSLYRTALALCSVKRLEELIDVLLPHCITAMDVSTACLIDRDCTIHRKGNELAGSDKAYFHDRFPLHRGSKSQSENRECISGTLPTGAPFLATSIGEADIPLGILVVADKEDSDFDAPDFERMQELATITASALATVYAYEDLIEKAERLEVDTQRLREQMLIQEEHARQALEAKNRALTRALEQAEWGVATIKGLSHNLKNVAISISRSCGSIIGSGGLSGTAKDKVEAVRQISDHMVDDFKRLFEATADPLYTSFNLVSLMNLLLAHTVQKHPVWERTIQVDRQYSDRLDITGDREKLEIAFRDLLANACEAMEAEGGTLTVKILPQSQGVVVEIGDTGKGIPEADLKRVFNPQYTSKAGGTGLGLWIAKQIIERMHQGRLSIRSQEGIGTTVEIWLPEKIIGNR